MKFKHFEHFTDPHAARAAMTAIIARRRSRQFAGGTHAEGASDPTRDTGDLDGAQIRVDYLLQSMHAALSAQRTLWSTFEMLRTAVRIEVGHELSDSALSYIGSLAANGVVDLVTYEHVAELLTIKDPQRPGEEGRK